MRIHESKNSWNQAVKPKGKNREGEYFIRHRYLTFARENKIDSINMISVLNILHKVSHDLSHCCSVEQILSLTRNFRPF
jgi:hypothetical protein